MVTLPIYAQDTIVRKVEEWIQDIFKDDEGVCYYKFPVVKSTTGVIPDLTVFVRTNEPLAIKCFPYQINEINTVDHDLWVVNDNVVDWPLLEHEDFVTELLQIYSKILILRNRFTQLAVNAFPVISQ